MTLSTTSPLAVRVLVLISTQKQKGHCKQLLRRPFDIKSRLQSPYFDAGVTQVKVTPFVGRLVPVCNSVFVASVQVMVQSVEIVERLAHMSSFPLWDWPYSSKSNKCFMSKLDMFKFVSLRQSLNIHPIFVTFLVLKLERSRLDIFWQAPNIPCISVTFSVLKLEMFRLERLEQ